MSNDYSFYNELLDTAIISLDASSMLDLIRFPKDVADFYFDMLLEVKNNLFITYQAGLEYSRNIRSEILSQEKKYKEAYSLIEKMLFELSGEIQNLFFKEKYRSPFINKSFLNSFDKPQKELLTHIRVMQEQQKSAGNDYHEKLLALIQNNVTNDFEQSRLEEIYVLGEKRYKDKIPPGYMDLGKNNDNTLASKRRGFGDLIIWEQLKDLSMKEKRNIIFITSDVKEDWFLRIQGKTQGVRPELAREFFNETGKHIIIYTPQSFVKHVSEYKNLKISPDILDAMVSVYNRSGLLEKAEIKINFLAKLLDSLDSRYWSASPVPLHMNNEDGLVILQQLLGDGLIKATSYDGEITDLSFHGDIYYQITHIGVKYLAENQIEIQKSHFPDQRLVPCEICRKNSMVFYPQGSLENSYYLCKDCGTAKAALQPRPST